MKKLLLLFFLIVACSESPVSFAKPSEDNGEETTTNKTEDGITPGDGHLFIIGGGARPDSLMTKYVALGGGKSCKVLVVPYASADIHDTGSYQVSEFKRIGVEQCEYISVDKAAIDTPEALAMLDGVTAVFFSGGDQNRLTGVLLGTKFLEKIKEIHKNGGVIGGTSAGAAVMSKIMLTGEEMGAPADRSGDFSYIKRGHVVTTEGFGFVTDAIVDQHFIIRKRENRLISILLENPELKGVGIDEATAIIVDTKGKFQVAGQSQVMVFEPVSTPTVTATGYQKINALTMRLLTAGDTYSLK